MKVVDKGAFFRSIGYQPHSAAQWAYHRSNCRFRVPICGRRFGKSEMAAKDIEPELILPKKRFWIVGQTYDLGDKEFRVIWDDLLVKKGLLQDRRLKRAYNKKQGDMHIEFPWGTRIEVRSAAHPDTLVGDSLDGAVISEAAKQNEETWSRFIRPALSDRRGWATFPSTPEGMNWLYDLWQLGRNPEYAGLYESWNFPSWENVVVYPGGRNDPEILLLEATMSVEEFLQEIAAQFTAFRGRIYSEFEEKTHVQHVPYDPALPTYGTWDFGFRDPCVFVEFQITPRDEIRIFREHYVRGKTLEEHVAFIKSRPNPEGYHLDLMFGDAADPEAITYINQHFGPCIGDPLAKSNWREGIDLVKSFVRLRDIGIYDEFERPIEHPQLLVDHGCKNTIREFNNYKTKETENSVRENTAAGAAQKQDDHAMDAIRYGLMHVFKLGARGHHLEAMFTPSELAKVNAEAAMYSETADQGFFSSGMRW